MREEFLIAFAVLIGVSGAVISALPAIGWVRRRRRRAAILDAFLHAVQDGQVRPTRFHRDKAIAGKGFVDILNGTAGTVPFRLTRSIVPFRSRDPYRLSIGDETFVFELDAAKDQEHPIVRTYLLKWQLPHGPVRPEAS